jgi:catalase (peroxidase I)
MWHTSKCVLIQILTFHYLVNSESSQCGSPQIRQEILNITIDPSFDFGSMAPLLVRLGWHASGLYHPLEVPHGGTNGGTFRLLPERDYEMNRGLDQAITRLTSVMENHPGECSFADITMLAAYLAINSVRIT